MNIFIKKAESSKSRTFNVRSFVWVVKFFLYIYMYVQTAWLGVVNKKNKVNLATRCSACTTVWRVRSSATLRSTAVFFVIALLVLGGTFAPLSSSWPVFLAEASSEVVPFTSSDTWIVPDGVFEVTAETWGGGGGGGGQSGAGAAGGGGGGAFARSVLSVTPGQTIHIVVGALGAAGAAGAKGGDGGSTFVGPDNNASNAFVRASGGIGGDQGPTGSGGAGGATSTSVGDVRYRGGIGGTGGGTNSGGGGSAAGSTDRGNDGAAPTGGTTVSEFGGAGADGGTGNFTGVAAAANYGGGGSGGRRSGGGSATGGAGRQGYAQISYVEPPSILSGTLFSDEGVTQITTSKTIHVAVGTTTISVYSTTTNPGSGAWTVTLPPGQSIATGTPITIWVDGDATTRAVTVTKASSTANITGIPLYQNRVLITHEATSGTSTTLADMAFYDGDNDSDIQFRVDSATSTLTVQSGSELFIQTGKEFAPGGVVTVLGNALASELDGSLRLKSGATYIAGGLTTLAGSLRASSTATFTPHSSGLTFNATTTGKTLTSNSTAGLGDLTFNGSGGAWSFDGAVATATNVTIVTGTLTAPATKFTMTGNFSNSGTYNDGDLLEIQTYVTEFISGRESGVTSLGGTIFAFTTVGSTLYVGRSAYTGTCVTATGSGCELLIYDIASTTNPVLLGGRESGVADGGSIIWSLASVGSTLYVGRDNYAGTCVTATGQFCELLVYDISSTTNPVFMTGRESGVTSGGGTILSLAIVGSTLYVGRDTYTGTCVTSTGEFCELLIYDIASTTNPVLLGGRESGVTGEGTIIWSLTTLGSTLYAGRSAYAGTCVTTTGSGCELLVYSISSTTNPVFMTGRESGVTSEGGDIFSLTTLGSTLYAGRSAYAGTCVTTTGQFCELFVYSIASTTNPVFMTGRESGVTDGGNTIWSLTTLGSTLYAGRSAYAGTCVTTTGSGCELLVYNISSTTNPTFQAGRESGVTDGGNTIWSLTTLGSTLYVGRDTYAGTCVTSTGEFCELLAYDIAGDVSGTLTDSSALGSVSIFGNTRFNNNASTTNLTIIGALYAPDSLSVSATFTNNGTFVANSGEVVLTGGSQSLLSTGTTTFNNLRKQVSSPATLTFSAAGGYVVTGTTTLTGTSGNLLSLRSTASGTQFILDPQGGRLIEYADVKDSYNANALVATCSFGCIDSDNNINWEFIAEAIVSLLSGTLYSDTGTTPAPAGVTISVMIGTSTPSLHSTTTSSGGAWEFTSLTIDIEAVASTTPLVLFISASSTDATTLVQGYAGTTTTNIPLYYNYVVAFAATPTSTIDLATFTTYDHDDDMDILFVTATSATSTTILADFINEQGTFQARSDATVFTGSFINNATFNDNGGMLRLTGTSEIIDGSITGASDLGNVTVAGSYSVTPALASTTNLTVSGALTISEHLSIAGDYTNSGTLTQAVGTTSFTGTSLWSGDGTTTFGDVRILGNVTSTHNATTSSFGIDSGATYAASSSLIVQGDFTNTGTFNFLSGTTTFTGVNSTVAGTLSDESALGNVAFIGSTTIASNASTTNLTNQGTLIAPNTLSVAGNYTNTSFFTHSSGTVIMSGTMQQTVTGTLSSTSAFHNLDVANTSQNGSSSSSVIFDAPVQTTGTFTMRASTSAQFPANSTSTFAAVDWNGGSTASPIYFRSSVTDTQWNFETDSFESTAYINVRDSYNSASTSVQCLEGCTNAGNNTFWTFGSSSAAVGALTVSDHPEGQADNLFSFMNQTDGILYRFSMTAATETAIMDDVTLSLRGIRNVSTSNVTDLRLYHDVNADGLLDGGDTQVLGSGIMVIDGQSGTVTFSTGTTSIATTSVQHYIVTADTVAIENNTWMTLELRSTGVVATGLDSAAVTPVFGTVSSIQHTRSNKGGGGSNRAAFGGDGPEGASIEVGGEAGGGDEFDEVPDGENISFDPNFLRPTNTGTTHNEWTNPENAYQSDGTYATAASTGLRQTYGGFGFSIPGTNIIEGIAVKVDASGSTAAGSIQIALSWNGGSTITALEATPTLTGSDLVYTLGGQTNLWGRAWSPTDFTDGNFTLRIIAQPSSNTVQLDAVEVRVYHIAGGGGAGAPGEF